MLSPIRVPFFKTNEEFHDKGIKLIGPHFFMTHHYSELENAIFSGSYATTTNCKIFQERKKKECPGLNKFELFEPFYIIPEPYKSTRENLFVPFSNPFVNKFQG